jgi:uncharacterized protein (DUF305 family)
MPTMIRLISVAAGACSVIALAAISSADEPLHGAHEHRAAERPPAFEPTREKPFSALMNDAMSIMDDGMARAPMNGNADHDFASMMIPHHQGAIDMAKAELLYGTNPVLRRLAQEIIVTQGSEIAVMQSQLAKPAAPAAKPAH